MGPIVVGIPHVRIVDHGLSEIEFRARRGEMKSPENPIGDPRLERMAGFPHLATAKEESTDGSESTENSTRGLRNRSSNQRESVSGERSEEGDNEKDRFFHKI